MVSRIIRFPCLPPGIMSRARIDRVPVSPGSPSRSNSAEQFICRRKRDNTSPKANYRLCHKLVKPLYSST
jgi:hypothetical protein